MRTLGLDFGTRTLGLSLSDETKTIASALKTIRYEKEEELIKELDSVMKEYSIDELVLGLPKNMNNTIGPRGEASIEFGKKLEERFQIPVAFQDERLSTVEATHYMIEADVSRKKRKKKIDSLAANIILQTYLDKKKGR